MLSQRQCIAFLHSDCSAFQIGIIKLTDHVVGFYIAHDLHFRITHQKFFNICTVIRLHMVDYQIVQRTSVENVCNIFNELTGNGRICGIHHNRFLVHDQIGVIRHSTGNRKKILKQRQTAVRSANPVNIFCYFSCTVHHIAPLPE